jgi:hypothetical protein
MSASKSQAKVPGVQPQWKLAAAQRACDRQNWLSNRPQREHDRRSQLTGRRDETMIDKLRVVCWSDAACCATLAAEFRQGDEIQAPNSPAFAHTTSRLSGLGNLLLPLSFSLSLSTRPQDRPLSSLLFRSSQTCWFGPMELSSAVCFSFTRVRSRSCWLWVLGLLSGLASGLGASFRRLPGFWSICRPSADPFKLT